MRLTGRRKAVFVTVRVIIIALLLLTLAGAQWYQSLEQKAVVFIVDRSDSMEGEAALVEWMRAAADAKKPDDHIGVIAVGANALIERGLSERSLQQFSLHTQMNRQFTHLAAGLQLAAGMVPDEASPRLVLISDGRENIGDLLMQGRLLKNKGIPIDVLIRDHAVKKDAAVERLHVPEQLYMGEKFSIEVTINSTFSGAGQLRIYEDNTEIANEHVYIERGENRFVLQGIAVHTGLHRYRAEIYVLDDEQAANNMSYAFSRVIGPPQVLIVEGEPDRSHNLAAMLQSSFIPHEVIAPSMLSHQLVNYTNYDSIIFNNVSADAVSEQHMLMIEQAVRDFGVGFMMIGGEDSFGLGGYFQTPLERTLPVYMDLRGKRELPSLALMLVIDKSGSMSGQNIELAREAAMRTVDLLRDQDTVGVIAFDAEPWTVVEPQQLTDRDRVIEAISSIQADGGTMIYDAVEVAYEKLAAVEAQRKHIILLTDGMSATHKSYEQLIGHMLDEQMTISTIGIGDGADQQLLAYIAALGQGRYYFTNDQSTIPAIFSREAVIMSRTYIVDEPFVPQVAQAGDWRALFAERLPQINAYVASTAKETAESVLVSPEPDPLLARWQYGAGKSVAWTSDLSGQWSGDWLKWEALPRIFTEIVKWTFPQFQDAPFQVNSRLEEGRVILDVTSNIANFHGALRATISDEALNQYDIELLPTAPGQYVAELDFEQAGAYLARLDVYDVADADAGADADADAGLVLLGSMTTGFVIPYSPEYKVSVADGGDKLRELAELTGGRILSLENPEQVMEGSVQPKRKWYDISHYLLIAALILWLFDIAIRRLTINWRAVFRLASAEERSEAAEQTDAGSKPVDRAVRVGRGSGGERGSDLGVGTGVDRSDEIDNDEASAKKDRMARLLEAKRRNRR